MELRNAIDTLLKVEHHKSILQKFVIERFNEEKEKFYSKNRTSGLFFILKSHKIINKDTIKVEYEFGTGDYTYSEYFIVDVRPYIRDEKINKIVNGENI